MGLGGPVRFVRFGPFQLDLRTGELRRDGIKVRVPDQSIKVLAKLVEDPGEIVTRQELHQKLWPNGTTVEFDYGINSAVKRLRQALEDSAETPRFIETLPRRGYRFLVEVETAASGETEQPSEPEATSGQPECEMVSHYRVLEKLGEGAMGVVYKAEDTKLGRFVALKFLAEELSDDPQALKRFEREARAASALNHPNICTIYDVNEHDDLPFIVMEYVEGRTLDKLIAHGALELSQVIRYAIDIADALAKAHAAGVIHRDLKPGNIMVAGDGAAKVLDFGIAKLTRTPGAGKSAAPLPTETAQEGMLGTISYMSPEQAEGRIVDARSDIFSFGALLYEMVTGQKAFRGDSKLSTPSAILWAEPKRAGQVVKGVPRELDGILALCLCQSPELRFQAMPDVKVALEEMKERLESRQRGRQVVWATVLLMAVVAGGAVWFVRSAAKAPAAALTAVPLITFPGMESEPSFSPDGNQIAFFWEGEAQDNQDIYVKRIGASGPPRRLTTDPRAEFDPTWSPDGRFIAFRRMIGGQKTEVLIIPATGGPERKIGEAFHWGFLDNINGAAGMAWSPDSKWLVLPDKASHREPVALFLLSVESGEKRKLTSPPAELAGDATPAFSPDGRTLAFSRSVDPTVATLSDLYLLALSNELKPVGEAKRITFGNRSAAGPAWTPDGREVIFSYGAFFSQPDLWRIVVSGPFGRPAAPQRLTSLGVSVFGPAISPRTHRLVYHHLSFRRSIRHVSVSGIPSLVNGANLRPVRKTVNLISSTRDDFAPQFSPDGKRVAFVSARSGSSEIWVCDGDGSNAFQVTSFAGPDAEAPSWSPDGRRIAFASNAAGGYDIWVVGLNEGKPQRMTTDPANDSNPIWSPDGRWIYFDSARTGENQVWKIPANGGEAIQVTRESGGVPHVSADGKYIYYARCPGLWRIPAEGGEATKVLDRLPSFRNLAIVNAGYYYITRHSIQFVSSATNKVRTVAKLEDFRDIGEAGGLTVSPDGRSILYTQVDQASIELMTVENFR
jgi:Tol biopolymer transport system component/DNA-binding winged helix-turn-helix (wHTH) protein